MIFYVIIILLLLFYFLKGKTYQEKDLNEENEDDLDEEQEEVLNDIQEIILKSADSKCRINMSLEKRNKCNKLLNSFTNDLNDEQLDLLQYFQNFNQILISLHKDFPLEKFIKNFGGNKKEYLNSRENVKKVLSKLFDTYTEEELKNCCETGEIINKNDYIIK